MHEHSRRPEPPQRHCLLNPKYDVVARATLIIPEVMVKAEFLDLAGFQQGNGFIWPKYSHPPRRGCSFVVEIHTHGWAVAQFDAVCSAKSTSARPCSSSRPWATSTMISSS